jgi:GT2 family glycosyltransferase
VPGADRASIDLVVATVGRTDELSRLLGSLATQSLPPARVLIVDQNPDERLGDVPDAHSALTVERLRSEPGLSRARNAALPRLEADLVAFPDDDCTYPPDLLARAVARFDDDPSLGILCGKLEDAGGRSIGRWPSTRRRIGPDDVWHAATSATIFARRDVVRRIGPFDQALGLGPDTRFGSGEEIDYLVRALRAGVRVEYDPSLVVHHAVRPTSPGELAALGRRDGGSVGYVLGRHDYPAGAVARMLVRPAVGALVSLVLLHATRARFQAATLVGRVCGLRYGRSQR